MNTFSSEEAKALRVTLGLDSECRNTPMRNNLHPVYVEKYRVAVDSLLARGYMELRTTNGQTFHAATIDGRDAVLTQPWPR